MRRNNKTSLLQSLNYGMQITNAITISKSHNNFPDANSTSYSKVQIKHKSGFSMIAIKLKSSLLL